MRRNGFTLIELLVAVSILAVLVTIAAPAFRDMYDRHRLKAAVDTLYGDLQFARSEAVQSKKNVYVKFVTGDNWCYGVSFDAACDCATVGSCDVKAVSGVDFPGTRLDSAAFGSGTTTHFDFRVGDVSAAGTAVLQSAAGKEGQVVVSLVGRARRCSPSGSTYISYYPSC